VTKLLFVKYYSDWAKKNKLAYKFSSWVPVKFLTFVSNDAIPGTSWIPSVSLSNDVTTKSMPVAKKKFSLMSKLRGSSSSTAIATAAELPSPVTVTAASKSKSMNFGGHSSSPSSSSSAKGKNDAASTHEEQAKDSASACSEDEKYSSPSSTGGEPLKTIRLPSTVPKNVPVFNLEIPSLVETLTSSHLRRLFFSSFLEFRLGDDEKALWNELSKFQEAFASLTDEEVASRQKDICEAAKKVLTENPRIPDHDDLVKTLDQSLHPVSSRFFLNAEVKLYELFHNSYQSFLANNNWVRH